MAGTRGPVPKRSDQRRRRNKPDVPIDRAEGAREVPVPEPDASWHPTAKAWFAGLAASGQSAFYEPSDWATAVLLAETMSRELSPQPVVSKDGLAMVSRPISGSALASLLKGMAGLMVTEGDRRRARLELMRPPAEDSPADVSELADYRRRAQSGG